MKKQIDARRVGVGGAVISIFLTAVGSAIITDAAPSFWLWTQLLALVLLLAAISAGLLFARKDPNIFVDSGEDRSSSRRSSARSAGAVGGVGAILLGSVLAGGRGGVNVGIGIAMIIFGAFVAYGAVRIVASARALKGQ